MPTPIDGLLPVHKRDVRQCVIGLYEAAGVVDDPPLAD
jgi:hypothetical protein